MSEEDTEQVADIKWMAKIVAVNCVRNTVIEDYHANGQLSQDDMKAFNQQVCNNIYTFLTYMGGPPERFEKLMRVWGMWFPHNWDDPELNEEFHFEQIEKAYTAGTAMKLIRPIVED